MAHAAVMKVESDEHSTCDKMSKLMQESINLFRVCGTDDPMYDKVVQLFESGYHTHARDYKPLLVDKILKEIQM